MAWDLMVVMRKYAYEHLKTPNDSLGAARRAMGGDSSCCDDEITASQIAPIWPNNVFILQFKRELIDEYGEDHFLPTKADIARELFSLGSSQFVDAKDRISALKEYASLRGFIEKPSAVNVNTGNVNNRVMVVQDYGSNDDWEGKALKQQTKLIASAKRK